MADDASLPAVGGGHRLWLVLQLLRRRLPFDSGFESPRYLTKWLLLGSIIGVVAGCGALVFSAAIHLATEFLLGAGAGYIPPAPVGEGATTLGAIESPWALPLITALGGLVSGAIVFRFAPEAEGHGTDAAIQSIHHKQGFVRARIPLIKLVASAITIGSGGSAGREGPAAQISAGFGSLLGRSLRLNAQDRRIAVAAGIGAGIGAIFRAPLGGAVMAAEILYIHDLEVEAIIPTLIGSIVGYSVYGSVVGFTPIFGSQHQFTFGHPVQLVYYAALGLLCGVVGIIYARTFYGVTDLFHRVKAPLWTKPALGGLLVGLLGLVLPQVLHTGYGWVQIGMTTDLLGLPLWVVVLLPFAKILATSLSIGSGGSGGIFGPGMVIGGMLGAAFWRLSYAVLPQMPAQPAPFVIIGMMAMFGGIAHAPLAVMLMVAEMTGNLTLLAPAMVAVAIATALVGDTTIYRSQLLDRASSPAHRMRFSFPLLASLLVRDAMRLTGPVLRSDMMVREIAPQFESADISSVAVQDAEGRLAGILPLATVRQMPVDDQGQRRVGELTTAAPVTLTPDESLDSALERLAEEGLSWAPVTEDGRLVGELQVRDIIQTYRATLTRRVRRVRALSPAATLFEIDVAASSHLAGKTLREAALPRHTLVVAVTRKGETIFPQADMRLEPHDRVMIMTDPAQEHVLRAYLAGNTGKPRNATGQVI